jgi:hypothetical protein
MGVTFLDTQLENMLTNFFVDDEQAVTRLLGQGLGNFAKRTAAAYCLGLICKTVYEDLGIVGKIRNRFAHLSDTSFEREPIKTWCFALRWYEFGMGMKAPEDATTREVFQVGVNQLICNLRGGVDVVRLERRKVPNDDFGGPTLLR